MNDNVRNSNDLPPSAVEALRRGRKLEAIKLLRSERGLDLKQAKDLVDAFVEEQPSLRKSLRMPRVDSGIARLLIVAALIAAAIVAYRLLMRS